MCSVLKKTLLLFGFISGFFFAQAQKGYEAGAWMGTAFYFGDLNNLYRLNEPGLAVGMIGRYNFNNRVCARIQGNFARLRASDAKSDNLFDRRRNLRFFSNIFEIAPALEINFLPYNHGSKDHFFTPYLLGGFSVFRFSPMTKYDGKTVALRELGTEGQIVGQEYGTINGSLMVGGGVKLDINYRWSLNFDISYRHTYTDYLDDVSKTYPNYNELLTNRGPVAVQLSDRSIASTGVEKIGVPGFQRGDSREKDAFLTLGVNLVYYFGRLRCPTISLP